MSGSFAEARARMAAELAATVGFDPLWEAAFASVGREDFIPSRFFDWDDDARGFRVVSRETEPALWARSVHDADEAIVTQLDDGVPHGPGVPSSSSSAPRVMARMLHALGPIDGGRVMEIGTGTGYNAALLSARLGGRRVVSVETDPSVAELAVKALARSGFPPFVLVGDGTFGAPGMGTFDAVIATCAVTKIPDAWLEQCPAGRIVAPFARPWTTWACVVLDVRDGQASGRFMDGFSFMWARGNRVQQPTPDTRGTAEVRESVTLLRPNRVTSQADPAAAFAISLSLPNCQYSTSFDADADSYTLHVWDTDGSWTTVEWTGDPDEYPVRQYGPRDLWNEISTAYRCWAACGQPSPDRYGLTVTRHGQHTIWLDDPHQHLDSLIAASSAHTMPSATISLSPHVRT